jgi:hypothetical protein
VNAALTVASVRRIAVEEWRVESDTAEWRVVFFIESVKLRTSFGRVKTTAAGELRTTFL